MGSPLFSHRRNNDLSLRFSDLMNEYSVTPSEPRDEKQRHQPLTPMLKTQKQNKTRQKIPQPILFLHDSDILKDRTIRRKREKRPENRSLSFPNDPENFLDMDNRKVSISEEVEVHSDHIYFIIIITLSGST